MNKTKFYLSLVFLSFLLLEGCSGDFKSGNNSAHSTQNEITQQQQIANALPGVSLQFKQPYFYSLATPQPATHCPGDAQRYDDPFLFNTHASSPYQTHIALEQSVTDPTTTIKPSFLKGTSVDLTNANASFSGNNAFSCSLGQGTTVTPSSNCATFDFGLMNGTPTIMGGSVLLIGGIQSQNYTGIQNQFGSGYGSGLTISCGPSQPNTNIGINNCNSFFYALSASALTDSSQLNNLSSLIQPTGPSQSAGAAAVYQTGTGKLLVFGGVSPASPTAALNSSGSGPSTYDSWVFNLATQQWTLMPYNPTSELGMKIMNDYYSQTTSLQLSKDTGGRSYFGYIAAPGFAIDHLSTEPSGGTIVNAAAGAAGVDTTDRIIITGGYGPCGGGICTDTHILNPTYGPTYQDAYNTGSSSSINNPAPISLPSPGPSQWIDSYPLQLISNSNPLSQYNPQFTPTPTITPTATNTTIGFGMINLTNNYNSTVTGYNLSSRPPTGYLLTVGGFNIGSTTSNATNQSNCNNLQNCGGMTLGLKWFNAPWASNIENSPMNFNSITNLLNYAPSQLAPLKWVPIPYGGGTNPTPWFGSGSLQKGVNIPAPVPSPSQAVNNPKAEYLNQVVYFGGADCSNFLLNTAATSCGWPNTPIKNPGKYWIFGLDPAFTFANNANTYPTSVNMTGAPINAGMATARGVDPSNKPIVVAWGGMTAPGTPDSTGNIYYLYNLNDVPTWASYPAQGGPGPLTHSSLVYSHITGSFYLFGGYQSSTGSSVNTTWKLSMGSTNQLPCGNPNNSNCTFSWQQLNSLSGQSCYPSCPSARRAHQMVEVNYNNTNPGGEPSNCQNATSPCSFGIFMEGGTTTGTDYLSDRWMFDPTANSGAGHWQMMSEMPPRSLAAMAQVQYRVQNAQTTSHLAVLFGGETGMQNPTTVRTANTQYFIPPTLGDTWMYDFDLNTWNRVKLYGERYPVLPSFSNATETQARAASLTNDPRTFVFSPPPLSGSTMITRTNPSFAIPQIFLFGGRKKDGTYNLLSSVYKFCAGTTGEKAYPKSPKSGTVTNTGDDGSCDAYDPITNTKSQNPVSTYTGRWLYKAPAAPSTQQAAFMGAATYDSHHDIAILIGGLAPNNLVNASVTDRSNRTISSNVLEYTFPSSSITTSPPSAPPVPTLDGSWQTRLTCPGFTSPTPRYGHTLSFDSLNDQLILVGGYDINGQLITQTGPNGLPIPDIQIGIRIDESIPKGIQSKNIPAITSGTPCYYWTQVNTFNAVAQTSLPSSGIAHSASVFLPTSGYNTGYYSFFDSSCINAGPIISSDQNINKAYAGGIYFDIDRNYLGTYENLLLHLTFFPLGPSNTDPTNQSMAISDSSNFNIHLIQTGKATSFLQGVLQPRYLFFANMNQYPKIVDTLSIIAPPTGQIRQEQIFIPLSINPNIDRIRIERVSGSGIIIDATLFRLGTHEQ